MRSTSRQKRDEITRKLNKQMFIPIVLFGLAFALLIYESSSVRKETHIWISIYFHFRRKIIDR